MRVIPHTLVRRGAATLKTLTSSRIHKTSNLKNNPERRHDKSASPTSKPRAISESVHNHTPTSNHQTTVQVKEQSSNTAKPSPFPDFLRPTPSECKKAHDILKGLHGDAVREVFTAEDAPAEDAPAEDAPAEDAPAEDAPAEDAPAEDAPAEDYPYAMDALVVAALSQATSWSNVKKAMQSMKDVYGSPFAYSSIVEGGNDKLVDALRPGGMQNRKAKILMTLLNDVKSKYGKWDLQHLFTKTDDEVITEVTQFWGIGLKCAHSLISVCLKRDVFAIDTHIYRLSGLWGWRPAEATILRAQAHLDARIPNELKFPLHYLMIAHGSSCLRCRENGKPRGHCKFEKLSKKDL